MDYRRNYIDPFSRPISVIFVFVFLLKYAKVYKYHVTTKGHRTAKNHMNSHMSANHLVKT